MKTAFFVLLSMLFTTSLCLANEPITRPVDSRVSQQKILNELRVSNPKHRQIVRRDKTTTSASKTAGLDLRANLNRLRNLIK